MAEDVFFKAKVAGKTYTLPKLTLGQGRIMKRDFGLDRMTDFDPFDADHMTGALFLCLREEDPSRAPMEVLAEIESMDIDSFEPVEEKREETPAPLEETAAPSAEESNPGPNLSSPSEPTPETPGDQT